MAATKGKSLKWVRDKPTKNLHRAYDIKVYGSENILQEDVVYVANHFHYLDPFFTGISVAQKIIEAREAEAGSSKELEKMLSEKGIWMNFIAKSNLFTFWTKGFMESIGAIPIERPYDTIKHRDAGYIERVYNNSKSMSRNNLKEILAQLEEAYSDKRPVGLALAGTRTLNRSLDEESMQRELEHIVKLEEGRKTPEGKKIIEIDGQQYEVKKDDSSLMRLATLFGKKKALTIVPVAVEVYQKDSKYELVKGTAALFGFYRSKKKIPVDIMFGEPISTAPFFEGEEGRGKKPYQRLAEHILKSYWELRHRIAEINRENGNTERSYERV